MCFEELVSRTKGQVLTLDEADKSLVAIEKEWIKCLKKTLLHIKNVDELREYIQMGKAWELRDGTDICEMSQPVKVYCCFCAQIGTEYRDSDISALVSFEEWAWCIVCGRGKHKT